MAYKIQIENNFFVLIDTSTSFEIIREVRDQVKFSVSTTIYKFKWNYANGPDVSNQSVTEFDFSNIVDSSGIAFASQAVLNAFLSANIGHINDLDVPIVIDETIIDNGTNSTLLRNEGGVVGDTDYTVPKTDGTANQVLQTNGAGVVTWQTLATGITIGTTPITSGVAGRVLFEGAGNVVQEDANFTFDSTLKRLTLKATGATASDIPLVVRNSADTLNSFQVAGNGAYFNGPAATAFSPIFALYRNNAEVFRVDEYKSQFTGAVYMNNIVGASTTGITFQNQSGGGKLMHMSPTLGTFSIGYSTTTTAAALDVKAQGALSTDIAFRVRNSADNANLFSIQGDGNLSLSNPSALGSETKIFGFGNTTDTILKYGNSVYGNVALGPNATYTIINSYGNVVLGAGASSVGGSGCVAIGNNVIASATGTITIGYTSKCFGSSGIKIGNHQGASQFGGSNSIHLGSTTSGNNISPDNVFMTYFNSQSSSTLTRSNGSFGLLGQQAYILQNGTGIYGIDTFMGDGGNTLVVMNHTAIPSTNITNAFQLYSNDITAGNAAPHFRTENGSVIKLYQQSSSGITTVADLVTVLTNLGLLA